MQSSAPHNTTLIKGSSVNLWSNPGQRTSRRLTRNSLTFCDSTESQRSGSAATSRSAICRGSNSSSVDVNVNGKGKTAGLHTASQHNNRPDTPEQLCTCSRTNPHLNTKRCDLHSSSTAAGNQCALIAHTLHVSNRRRQHAKPTPTHCLHAGKCEHIHLLCMTTLQTPCLQPAAAPAPRPARRRGAPAAPPAPTARCPWPARYRRSWRPTGSTTIGETQAISQAGCTPVHACAGSLSPDTVLSVLQAGGRSRSRHAEE